MKIKENSTEHSASNSLDQADNKIILKMEEEEEVSAPKVEPAEVEVRELGEDELPDLEQDEVTSFLQI